MNTHPDWLKKRSHSTPLSSEYLRIRSKDFAKLVDMEVKLRMRAKKLAYDKRFRPMNPRPVSFSQPRYLVPRMEIIDNKALGRLLAKLEIPDVSPDAVKLELQLDILTVSGEREPQLSAVPSTYRTGFQHHSQIALTDSDPRARFIVLGGGRVESAPFPQQPPVSLQIDDSSNGEHPLLGRNTPVDLISYNELRYGPFRRILRVAPGTKASDIKATFSNGMLFVSWPKSPRAPEQCSDKTESAAVKICASDTSITPVTVKVESVDT